MPKRSAPLASGGRIRGRITIVCNRILPLKLYRAKQYARGIPNRIRKSVEMVEEIKLKKKALLKWGFVKDSSNLAGSIKDKTVANGKAIYATIDPDKINIKILNCWFLKPLVLNTKISPKISPLYYYFAIIVVILYWSCYYMWYSFRTSSSIYMIVSPWLSNDCFALYIESTKFTKITNPLMNM